MFVNRFVAVMATFFILLTATNVAITARAQEAAPAQAQNALPEGAILLFGEDPANPGVTVNRFLKKTGEKADWNVADGCLISTGNPNMPGNSNHVYADEFFKDAHLHVEFMIPENGPGNSGVYIHGHYEMQIIHTPGDKKDLSNHDAGAIYGFFAPKANAALARGQWQTYEIDYTAPRRDENGKITEEGHITARLNGQLVQHDVRFGEPRSEYHPFKYGKTENLEKIWAAQKKTSVGPVFLQDHGSPVKFRNVWIKKTS